MKQTICEGDLLSFLRKVELIIEDEKPVPCFDMRIISFSPVGEYVVSIFKLSNDSMKKSKEEFEDEMLENVVQGAISSISSTAALYSAFLDIIDLHEAFSDTDYYRKFKYSSRLSSEHVKVHVADLSLELKDMIALQQEDRIKKFKKKMAISKDNATKDFLTLCPELEVQCPGSMKILGNIG